MTTEAHAGAILTVDLGAIRANWRLLRDRARPAACAAVVKADAYGLGAARVAPALAAEGARDFFVALLDEGLALRPLLPADARVWVLNGLPPGAEGDCAAAGLRPVLNSLAQLDAWAALGRRLGRALPAALQIDSGMARLGLSPPELDRLADDPARLRGVDLALVMSHLACADVEGHPASAAQRGRFGAALARLPRAPASLANSAGVFLGGDYHHDLVRPGAALYGINPTPWAPNPMRPAARLDARLIQTRPVAPGEAVGYGWTWTAPQATRVATISLGYADGWPRSLSGKGAGFLGGVAAPAVGRVSMDSLMLDVGAVPDAACVPGAAVAMLGPGQDVDAVAALAGTIGYEVLTGLGGRLHRRWIDASDGQAGGLD